MTHTVCVCFSSPILFSALFYAVLAHTHSFLCCHIWWCACHYHQFCGIGSVWLAYRYPLLSAYLVLIYIFLLLLFSPVCDVCYVCVVCCMLCLFQEWIIEMVFVWCFK